jgi:drug/metabolite transporter (DMT)-like permease
MAFLIKFIKEFPLIEIVFFRSLPIVIFSIIILKNKNIAIVGNNRKLLFLRGLLGSLAMSGYYYTCTVMLLADAIILDQLIPFFVIILSVVFLKEKINVQQVPIILIALLGSLLVAKPGFRVNQFPVIVGLSSAIIGAIAHTIVRILRKTDHPLVIVNYFGMVSGFLSLISMFLQKNFVVPNLMNLIFMTFVGISSLGAQYFMTKAYQMAPANLVSLYLYLQIFFGVFLANIFFQEIPDIFSIIGINLIIFSSYFYYKIKEIK